MENGLIESDWNLKTFNTITARTAAFGLIESDWNLKEMGEQKPKCQIEGINRIRLEFKVNK